MTGHVFAVRADLLRLACDAVVPSCDDRLNISRAWEPLAQGTGTVDGDWLRLSEEYVDGRIVRLPGTGEGPDLYPVICIRAEGDNSPEAVSRATVEGVRQAAEGLQRGGGRALPLIGLHITGVGAGGLEHRRGEVIDLLLPLLQDVVRSAEVDVALGMIDRRDLAAIQARRRSGDWDLPEHLAKAADDLGERAAAGELSLFLGAGLGQPVGLPTWSELVRALAEEAGREVDPTAGGWTEIAAPIVRDLGPARYHQLMQERLRSSRHGLGHALLANLGVQQMVTTNFDRCHELALETVHGPDGFRVLTRDVAVGGVPWLLKLHGDIERPESLVFTPEDYRRHPEEYAALHGVVQSLMLTSHLLFVGFSLTDRNFLAMAEAATRVRGKAEDPVKGPAGTALALTPADIRPELEADLAFHVMGEDDPARAARTLEVFLDRLAWKAATVGEGSASYLLDERFASGLSPAELRLKEEILDFVSRVDGDARDTLAWHRIEDVLRDLGREQ